ncbi:hypothetical protein DVH05_000286 [Phytophthora capsici]|nr:hypothetical protein DVH05_000286 [Phytophthora capsici]
MRPRLPRHRIAGNLFFRRPLRTRSLYRSCTSRDRRGSICYMMRSRCSSFWSRKIVSIPRRCTHTLSDHHLNSQKPIWMRKPDDVTHEEYASFYKRRPTTGRSTLPSSTSLWRNSSSSRLVCSPPNADMFEGGAKNTLNDIKLYVRRVFIMDNCKELMPEYLSFVKPWRACRVPFNVQPCSRILLRVEKNNLVKKYLRISPR